MILVSCNLSRSTARKERAGVIGKGGKARDFASAPNRPRYTGSDHASAQIILFQFESALYNPPHKKGSKVVFSADTNVEAGCPSKAFCQPTSVVEWVPLP